MMLRTHHATRRERVRLDNGRLQYRTRLKAINDQDEGGNNPEHARSAPALHESACPYFDTVSDALATLAADAFAAVSSTTTVIFMLPWPSPQ